MIKMRNQKGFTLVELLVVVVIIGILASVAIPNFVGAQDKAKNSGVQSNAHTVQMAVEQYGVDMGGTFPANLADIVGTGSYIAGDTYPKTPWNTQQANNANIACVATDVTQNNNFEFGAGTSPAAVTAKTHYGAISWLRQGTANEQYILIGTGKKGDKAVKTAGSKNF